jgi:hypothetical protein
VVTADGEHGSHVLGVDRLDHGERHVPVVGGISGVGGQRGEVGGHPSTRSGCKITHQALMIGSRQHSASIHARGFTDEEQAI